MQRSTRLFALFALCFGLLNAASSQPEVEGARAIPIVGRVVWPDHDLSATQIRVYADPHQRKLVDVFGTGGKSGAVVFALPPGTYYLMAFSDQDGDKRASAGDGVGFYGVTDVSDRPQPFVVDAGAGAMTLVIPIAFKIAADGKTLEAVPVHAPTPYGSAREARISGTVSGFGEPLGARYVLLIPLAPSFPPRAAVVGPDGAFELNAVPGTYHLIAVENLDDSDDVGPGDLVAVYQYEPAMGPSLPTVKLTEDERLTDVRLDLRWALGMDGRLRSGDGAVLGPRINVGILPALCVGTVTRLGQPVPHAVVRVYGDQALQQLHATAVCDEQGQFCLALPPAAYFLTALRDVNQDGATGPGDELGFLGVTAADLSQRPQPLSLSTGELRRNLEIPLVMVVGPDTSPVPLTPPPALAAEEHLGPGTEDAPDGRSAPQVDAEAAPLDLGTLPGPEP